MCIVTYVLHVRAVDADIDKENNSQDCNAMVDQVLKKYKLCEVTCPIG